MIYLDHAASAFPKAPGVAEEAARFLREDAGNPGRGAHALARRASDAVERTRQGLALLLGVPDAARLALTSGATEGLNVALRGLLPVGARALVGPEAHNSVLRPLSVLARERGVVVEEVRSDDALRWDLDDLEARLRAGPCALVVVGHGSNVTGALQDLVGIAARARAAGARVLVDGAQTVGAVPVPLDAVDVLAFSGHKALLGPPGTGGLWVRTGIELPPLRVGGTGSQSEREEPPSALPGALEAGTPNAVGFAALGAAVDWLRAEGPATLAARARAAGNALRAGLAELPGVRVCSGGEEDLPVVSFVAEGWDVQELAAVLDHHGVAVRAGLHCAPRAHRRLGTAPGGTLRASAGPFVDAAAIEEVLSVLASLLAG
ncbi:MAG: aminotransferase class V-fold PLP-dependent enzyme [Planctomycetota bacterium]|nr:MAG: aminotransferase class V-fold PLP-dependent enzyme [Planctomycetota bacterium]